jgi:lysine methyltransferase
MGELVRTWSFEIQGPERFELIVKEPAITGDNLGFKTWGSSYRLALELERLSATSLSEVLGSPRPRVLELGSGTGLLGLAAAAIWKTHVILSDLPDIVSNLTANTERNADLLASRGGSVEVGTLVWGSPPRVGNNEPLFRVPNQFKVAFP